MNLRLRLFREGEKSKSWKYRYIDKIANDLQEITERIG